MIDSNRPRKIPRAVVFLLPLSGGPQRVAEIGQYLGANKCRICWPGLTDSD